MISASDTPDNRALLLETAWALFAEHGYDKTSVDAILGKAGLSKGTFYHYFASKEELLDSLTASIAERGVDQLRRQLEKPGRNAARKLNIFFSRSRQWRLENISLMHMLLHTLYRSENALLLQKMNHRNLELATPLVAEILQQGVNEGSMQVADPFETARLLNKMLQSMMEIQAELLLDTNDRPERSELILRRVSIYLTAVERIVGLPAESLDRPNREFIEQFVQAWVAVGSDDA